MYENCGTSCALFYFIFFFFFLAFQNDNNLLQFDVEYCSFHISLFYFLCYFQNLFFITLQLIGRQMHQDARNSLQVIWWKIIAQQKQGKKTKKVLVCWTSNFSKVQILVFRLVVFMDSWKFQVASNYFCSFDFVLGRQGCLLHGNP